MHGIKLKNKYITSMRFTLLVIVFLITFVSIIVGVRFLIGVVEDTLISQRIEKLKNQTTILRNHIISEKYMEDEASVAIEAEISQLSSLYDSRIQLIDTDFRIIKDTYYVEEDKINIYSLILQAFKGENVYEYDRENQVIRSATSIASTNEPEHIIGVLYMTFSTQDIYTSIEKVSDSELLFEILILVIVIGVTLLFSGIFVKPLKQIEQSIDKISAGNFEKMSIKGYYETEQITDAFNEMLDKLKELEDSRQEFVSNVSHELKTPMTSIKVLADSLLVQDNIPEEMYKEFLGDIVNEIDRENEIITDLLSLVKMDKSAAELNVSQANINDIVEVVLKRLRPIAAKKNIELIFESFRPVIAEVDEVKLSIIINNLVENAVKYNVLDGAVRISLNADHKYFYLKVSDTGIGIPEDMQDKIFDRFYRVDRARARETGGTGLGLAITKSSIMMHRGIIKVHSKENEGTTFTVRIPLNYIK